jgi:hypothetical protein
MSFPTTSATNVTATGKTGSTCQRSGPYKSSTSVVVYFKQGDTFTLDPTNGKGTTWTMVN